MNDGLYDDIKKKFMLPLTTELQNHKEKVFHNASASLTVRNHGFNCTFMYLTLFHLGQKIFGEHGDDPAHPL